MSSLRPDAVVGSGFLTLGTGEAVARIVAFVATVYLARRLRADAYGAIVLATTIMAYVGRLSDCGVDLLGVRDVAHDPTRLPELLPSFLGARLLVAGPLILLTAGVGLLVFPSTEGAVLAAYAFTLLPLALGTHWVHLGLGQFRIVSISRGVKEGLTALLILALVHYSEDVGRVPVAAIAGEGLGAFLLLWALPRVTTTLNAVLRFDVVVSLYRRSWPLVLHALLGLLIMKSDFFFLRIYRDSATVGHYAVSYALISFFVNLGHSYQLSLLPVITRLADAPDRQGHLYQTAAAQVFAGAFPLAIGGCLVAERLVPAVFGSGYAASVIPLQILVWSVPVALMRNVAQSVLIARGRQDLMFRSSAWAAASNVMLNFAVIPFWGMTGAAMVTVVSESVRLLPMLTFTRRTGLPMVSPRRFWRTLLAGGVMAAVVTAVALPTVWLSMALGALTYACTLCLTGGLQFRRGSLPKLMV
ncbi:MAG: flippase [Vicinamibacterales bacterium]